MLVRIPQAVARNGIKRSRLYEMATYHPGLFRKLGGLTLVDLEKLDAILSAMPAANINVGRKKPADA
jgi:hypothetical protein